ncbi:FG-GAP-like repeat-containing protein [Streptomyces orinoci]|uniref:FG-GAP-like repeat-containing protein n=1 Tax=Streptomyces orinoci TaxID=67339 RepID=A0ABV3K6H8_STRON|nr:FG-GAP-like repeat-containing protein [Streptomyces orinoci]
MAAGDQAHPSGGLKSVGALFGLDKNLKAHYCSASVVQSPGHNLILTAGHCAFHEHVAFVPNYSSAAVQPYGIWPVKKWFIYGQYQGSDDRSPTSDLDFSFASLKSVKGKNVQDVVGGNTLARTKSFYNNVTIFGYPMIGHNRADTAVKCDTKTWPLSGYNQMQIDCAGMWGGVSGGPWFSEIHGATGVIIGNVGGYNGGGITKTDWRYPKMYDRITYSPMHQDYFFRLYDDAQHGRSPHYSDYQQPTVPGYTMGGASTWKHAKLMAAGDFNGRGRSDLIVVWTDGEVTLYNSDGRGGFSGEQPLAPQGSVWKYAEGITAGDFTGSNQFDLLVRWSDGEVSLFGDVGSRGLNWDGTTMVEKKTAQAETWKHATQITAGRFNADKYVTDLMVRWSDGELTLYTNVGAERKFSEEHKLKDSNKAWEDATLLTAGEFSGNSKWDLLVRWKDGSINSYVGTTVNGLGATHTVHGGNFSTWTHSTVMTTGNFTGNGRTDDLVIRWSDGETSLYEDTSSEHLGTEHTLVPSSG